MRHHAVSRYRRVPGGWRIAPNWRGCVGATGLGDGPFLLDGLFCPFCLWRPQTRSWRVISMGRADQRVRPSIACWRDHSTGASRNRVTPMPRGSRPSMAALTRSGARKARDTVMLTWRTLHLSRFAMHSASAFASVTSSSSQRRPRAIDATKVARVSDRMGRACCGGSPTGARISRRRVDGVLCHGT